MRIFAKTPGRGLFISGGAWFSLAFLLPAVALPNDDGRAIESTASESSVYAVYGVNDTSDFLPDETTPVRRVVIKKRKKQLLSPLELPDGFYVIGIPVFSILFLIILMEMLKEMPDTTDTH